MLSAAKRKEYFKFLGLGDYNSDNILKMQKKYFPNKKDHDGKYGNNTDILLQSLYNVKKYTKSFALPEFQCGCGGKYCSGYPAVLNKNLLKNLQTIRDESGPITITCGERCAKHNAELTGSVSNSKHKQGKAADIYGKKLTSTYEKRMALIKRWYKLPNASYAYGNTPNMGNAVHVDVK